MGEARTRIRPPRPGAVRRAAAPAGTRAATTRRPSPAPQPAQAVLDLQATAGNQAVAGLLTAVQRQPATPRATAGWTGADTAAGGGPGWNAAARDDVEGTGIRRIPLDDIPAGNQLDWSPDYDTKDGAQSEKNRTTETAAGRAIVLKPAGLAVDRPIDVLLHLHGYTSRRGDPAAGWRQSKVPVTRNGKSYKPVRDIDQDRIAQQMATVTRTNPQTLAILPQGVGHSFFGADFEPRSYIDAVVTRLQAVKELPVPAGGSLQTNLILSAHSGGGHTVRKALRAELDAAKAQARAAARAAKKGQPPPGPAPALNPTQVVLFEAINNATELSTVVEWVYLHLNRTRDALNAAGNPISRIWAIAGCPTLRAYRSRAGYKSAYDDLDAAIRRWFSTPTLGGSLPAAEKDLLRDRFKVEVLHGVTNAPGGLSGHEQVVGGLGTPEQGPLADALAARTDPSSSRLLKGPPAVPGTSTRTGTGTGTASAGPARQPDPAPTTARPITSTATPSTRTPTTSTPTTSGPAAGAPNDRTAWITDTTRTTLELLPAAQRTRFETVAWNDLDYPGTKLKIKDTSAENLARWRADPGYQVFSVPRKTKDGPVDVWYLRGAHQREAAALLLALSRVRPGGGERRVNTGADAVLTKKQFATDPAAYDEYIAGQLRDPAGETKSGTRKMLNRYAAEQYSAMRTAAAKDGVTLSIGNAFRERKRAEKAARSTDNSAAVASYSAHSLGLAMDLNLRTRGLRDVDEVTTRMTNTIRLLAAPAYKWMFEHGAAFGFFQYRNEPWHWEYNPPGFDRTFWADRPDLAPGAAAGTAKK